MKRARGFTLLEVLVALAVIGLGLFAAVKAAGSYAGNLSYLQDRVFAHWVARNTLNELQLAQEWPAIGSKEDRTQFGDRDWTWHTIVSQTPDKDMRKVEVKVWSGQSDDGEPVSILTGYLEKR